MMNLCIGQATLLSTPFADDVNACADVGWTAVEVWLTKLEKHLETNSVESARILCESRGIRLVAAAYQGGLLLSQGDQRKAHFDHFQKRLALCEALKIPTMLIAPDYLPRMDEEAWRSAVVSFKQAAQWAAASGVTLALEFRAGDSFCTNLESAALLSEACGEPNAGLCLDLFHFYKGPSKFEDLVKIDPVHIRHVQICDAAGVLRETMADADRILPGEGDFAIGTLMDTLRKVNYAGYVSLELMNPILWGLKPTQVAELGLTAMEKL